MLRQGHKSKNSRLKLRQESWPRAPFALKPSLVIWTWDVGLNAQVRDLWSQEWGLEEVIVCDMARSALPSSRLHKPLTARCKRRVAFLGHVYIQAVGTVSMVSSLLNVICLSKTHFYQKCRGPE
jgi:hypothetical protein